jgi:hypothetical protein
MISVKQNPNFKKFFQVFSFGKFIDEVVGQSKALRLAKDEAKSYNIKKVNFLGNVVDINDET